MVKKITHHSVDFSVVIPTYNRSEFLKSAILSVLRQRGVKLEIVICDDASTDETGTIVRSFKDGRIKYYRNSTRRGTSMNFLNCFKYARGNYIFNLGDDDLILDDTTLLRVLRTMKQTGSGMGKIGTITYERSVFYPYQVSALSEKPFQVSPKSKQNILIDTIPFGLGFYSGLIFNNKLVNKSYLIMDHVCFPDHMCHSYHKIAYDLILKRGIIYIPNEFILSHLSVDLIPRYFNIEKHGRIYWEDPINEAKSFLSDKDFASYARAYTRSQLVMLPNIKYFTSYAVYVRTLKKIIQNDLTLIYYPYFIIWAIAGLLPKTMIGFMRKIKNRMSMYSTKRQLENIHYGEKIRKLLTAISKDS